VAAASAKLQDRCGVRHADLICLTLGCAQNSMMWPGLFNSRSWAAHTCTWFCTVMCLRLLCNHQVDHSLRQWLCHARAEEASTLPAYTVGSAATKLSQSFSSLLNCTRIVLKKWWGQGLLLWNSVFPLPEYYGLSKPAGLGCFKPLAAAGGGFNCGQLKSPLSCDKVRMCICLCAAPVSSPAC